MKISVLIIAHNEEKYIAQCIESVLNQTDHPNEVVVLVHNSSDKTLEIARDFPVTVAPFNGPKGIIHARLEGLNRVSGDIILCLDGDAFVRHDWVEVMTATLKKGNNVLVGSRVKFKGAIFGYILNMYGRNLPVSKKHKVAHWMWGSSLAFWGKDKEFIQKIIRDSVILSDKMGLTRNLEDYWLALFMSRRGTIEVTNKTYATVVTKNSSSVGMFFREKEDRISKQRMNEYFEKMDDKA